jgi:2-deoxy-D-gluconate 3-dehydrogenase
MIEELFGLKGRVAMVTGGNGGIGKGIADGLAAAGASIVVAARNEEKTRAAVADIKSRFKVSAMGVQMDVVDEASVLAAVDSAVSEFGTITVLVNNAGVNIRRMPDEYALEEWDQILDVNLRGAFVCSRAVYPHMKKAGRGKVINIGSMTSLFGLAKTAPYACSKMGILSLTYSLGLAWARENIQVNCILPGWIDTPLTKAARKDFAGLDDFVANRVPQGRWGKPEDFAGLVVFLASSASDYLTAEYIRLDGGFAQSCNTISF